MYGSPAQLSHTSTQLSWHLHSNEASPWHYLLWLPQPILTMPPSAWLLFPSPHHQPHVPLLPPLLRLHQRAVA